MRSSILLSLCARTLLSAAHPLEGGSPRFQAIKPRSSLICCSVPAIFLDRSIQDHKLRRQYDRSNYSTPKSLVSSPPSNHRCKTHSGEPRLSNLLQRHNLRTVCVCCLDQYYYWSRYGPTGFPCFLLPFGDWSNRVHTSDRPWWPRGRCFELLSRKQRRPGFLPE